DVLLDNYTNLSETEEHLGNYKNALEYYKTATVYKDSIFNDANKKKIEVMEIERIEEGKDQQIKILNQQKTIETSEIKRQTLIRNTIIGAVMGTGLLAILSFVFYNKRKQEIFEAQVMQVENKALRAQMNPHFIFNSLH